ncbi:MAG: carbohydrate kinase family protein [Candidatus Roizmanbacteria bacterium]|nr:MAG: carbohydrate kinase family protein [Candidatus Roizmanbacteria bacterium]
MYDLITLGSISVDLYFKGDSLTIADNRFQLAYGGKYFTDYFHEGLGGGAVNVAIGAQKNGLRASLVAAIGNNDFKHFIKSALHKNSVSDFYCRIKEHYYNISAILLTDNGEKTIINFQNANHNLFENKRDYEILGRTKAIFIASALEDKLKVLVECESKDILAFVNLGKKDCKRSNEELEEIIQKTTVLFVNGHEFAELVKKPYEEVLFHKNIVDFYFPSLQNKILVVTDGKNGSFAYQSNKVFFQKAIDVPKIVDTTGSGDAYTAGFIAEFFKSRNITSAMENGAIYAAKILQKIGAN